MAAKKRAANHRELFGLSKNILQDIRDDFIGKGLSANSLTEHYVGIPISQLQQKYCEKADSTQVDFDLALKELEDGLLIGTGPMVPFDNRPNSGIFVIGLFSKREYVYLTEAGYRTAALISSPRPQTSSPHVLISGGIFHQSQIGVGGQVTQEQKIDVGIDAEAIERLTQLLLTSGAPADGASNAEIARLVAATYQGNLREVKPIFQKLFGLASETVKQTAWGILNAIIIKAIGM